MSFFKAKMHQIRIRLGSAPDPAGGAYTALPQGPDPPLRIRNDLYYVGWGVKLILTHSLTPDLLAGFQGSYF